MSLLPFSLIFYRTDLVVKTVIIELLQQVSVSCLPKYTTAILCHRRRSGMSFLNSGDQTCPSIFFFLIHFKGMVLEELAPICKREKSSIHNRGFFPLEASFPALDGGADRLSTEAFFPWSDLVCSYQHRHLTRPSQFHHRGGMEMHQQ